MRITTNGTIYLYYGHGLGSARAITNSVGQLCYDADFYPFGGERPPYVNNCGHNYKFAGMERDAQTGNDHTWFRQYVSNLGRWLTPDPLAGDITNPQSLNRYAYVLNNPTTLTDPLGLQGCVPGVPGYEEDCPQMGEQGDSGGGASAGWMDPLGIFGGRPHIAPLLDTGRDAGSHGGGCPKSPTYDKEKCEQALSTAGTTTAAVGRALDNWPMIQQAAVNNGVDPTILAAVGIRESGFQNIPQHNGGPGMGIFQIESTSFPNAVPFAYDPARAANFAAGLLGGYYRANIFNRMSPPMALAAALRSYNRGPGGLTPTLAATGWPGYMDVGTQGQNYVSNVAAIAVYCF